jgi:Leucine-rich repeat (LRR) protein
LAQCEIENLSPQIEQLTQLKHLWLQENKLTALPKEIGELVGLETLSLHSNQLTTLPKQIEQLQKLTELDLRNNPLTHLPDSIGELQNLQVLRFDTGHMLPEVQSRIKALLPNCAINHSSGSIWGKVLPITW